MWKLTKQYWKDMWNTLWSKTTVDEKAIATIKEVGNQIGDIDNALKGEERKGRKNAKK